MDLVGLATKRLTTTVANLYVIVRFLVLGYTHRYPLGVAEWLL